MTDKLTDLEIVKALECCRHDDYDYCEECPYRKNKPCQENLIQDCFDLINRLQCERNKYRRKVQNQREEINRQKADIKKLTSGKCVYLSDDETTEYCVEGPCPNYKTETQIKASAYKEFAERLKEKAYTYSDITGYQSTVVDVNEIDGVYEELVGEDNAEEKE